MRPRLDPPSAELPRALREARGIVVLTGAGVSAESGIPTFREAGSGRWAGVDPETVATRTAFRRDPQRVWDWYAERRARIDRAQPNPAHRALVELERRSAAFLLVTQNVDGLHRAAGSRALIELHGNIHRLRCFDEDRALTESEAAAGDGTERPPRCPRCGGRLRPDVVWFGEPLDPRSLERVWRALGSCDLFLSVGTSGWVEPAASLAREAGARGARLVEINPEPTPLTSRVDHCLRGLAGDRLPRLVAAAWPQGSGDP
ncbi:MAG: NAD-dependent deacylase [Chloroflexi bacterium]|nr:NAD-dependent deacylase [Chloroflexota bacterium]